MNSALFSRRQMLKVGALGGLTLSQYMRLQASTKEPSQKRSGIFIFLEGGPSHQDTFDLKPDAPSEYRGEFKPISTSVPGIQICEHLPELAKRMPRTTPSSVVFPTPWPIMVLGKNICLPGIARPKP